MPDQSLQFPGPVPQISCSAWVKRVFRATAVAGPVVGFVLAAVAMAVFINFAASLIRFSFSTPTQRDFVEDVASVAVFLLFSVILWRQFLLKRWACVAACCVAWGITFFCATFSVQEWARYFDVGVFPASGFATAATVVTGIVALAITAALARGWKGLAPGF